VNLESTLGQPAPPYLQLAHTTVCVKHERRVRVLGLDTSDDAFGVRHGELGILLRGEVVCPATGAYTPQPFSSTQALFVEWGVFWGSLGGICEILRGRFVGFPGVFGACKGRFWGDKDCLGGV